MRFGVITKILFVWILGTYFLSCRASRPVQQDVSFEISQQQQGKLVGESVDGESVNGESVDGESQQNGGVDHQQTDDQGQAGMNPASDVPSKYQTFSPGSPRILHPKRPTAWFTRRLVMTATQPSATKIVACRERIEAVVFDAPNLAAIDSIALSLQAAVGEDKIVYHWCFYQIMADLDIQLEHNTPLMQDKAEIFLGRMKTLWVLGRALDSGAEQQTYIRYLRARYTEISQTVFGRNLETVDLGSFSMPTSGAGKPASEFEE